MRILLTALGFCSVGFGIAGLFIPLWPSTVFFLIAAALFAKSSPKAEKWLLEHRAIGAIVRDWRDNRSISRSAKISATIAILLSFAVSIFVLNLLWLRIVLAIFAIGLIAFICCRPEASQIVAKSKHKDIA